MDGQCGVSGNPGIYREHHFLPCNWYRWCPIVNESITSSKPSQSPSSCHNSVQRNYFFTHFHYGVCKFPDFAIQMLIFFFFADINSSGYLQHYRGQSDCPSQNPSCSSLPETSLCSIQGEEEAWCPLSLITKVLFLLNQAEFITINNTVLYDSVISTFCFQ